MSSDRRARALPFRLKTLGGAVAAAMLAANVHAAALGNLTVLSALGQPLHAEIELISTVPEDTGSLLAKVASFDTFRQANIDYNPVLSSLRFAIEQRGERRFIRVTSVQPVNEPFVDLLLELRGPDSRLVREYLFLLDPPAGDAGNPPSVASPASVLPAGVPQQPRQATQASSPAATRPAQEPTAAPAKPARPPAAQPAPANAANAADAAPARSRQPASGKSRLSLTDISVAPGNNPTFAAEERVVMERAVAEANERVKILEQKVDAMQKLLAATNNLLAELRKHNDTAKGTGQAEPAAAPAPAPASAPAASTPAAAAPAASAEAKPAESTEASAPAPVAKPAVPAPAKPRPAPPPPPPPPGLLDTLLDNLFALAAGGLSLLLLGGAGAYFVRRRKQQQPFASTLFADAADAPATAPAPTVGQDGDADQSVYIPGFSSSGNSSGTGDDPVAEADVYIAYGRDGQAEQILKDALQKQPERHAVRLKLLSIYASRKDRASFESQARELHAMTAGLGEEWVRAAALGAAIDPGNVLYAASQPKAEAPAPEAGGSDLADLLGTVPAEQPQEDSGNATAFDFTRELSLPAQGASVPDLPPLDTLPLATEESAPIDLDFALGIPPEEEPAPPPASAPAAGKLPSGPGPIDFDLGLPEEPALVEPVEAAPAPEVPEQIIAEIAAEIAADIPPLEPEQPSGPGPIEFELPELPQAMPEEPVADPAPSGSTVSGPGPIDFELPDLPLAALEEPAAEVAPKTDASSGPGPIDFDFELPEIPALAQLEESPADLPQADGADAGAMIDLDGMLADLMPTEKKPE